MGKSSTISNNTPSFFKVLIASDFDEKLRIPPAYIKHFNEKLPCKSILTSPTGKSWTVQVKKIGKDLCFWDGWKAFVNRHSLEFGDFLVFKYYGDSKFRVKIYGRTACEKEVNLKDEEPMSNVKKEKQVILYTGGNPELTRKPAMEIEGKSGAVLAASSVEIKHPNFSAKARDSRKYHMTIRRTFGKETGLLTKNRLVLEDPNGKSWSVKLSKRRDGRLDMTDGWAQFCKGNKVKTGDTFLFEFNGRRGKMVRVRVSIFRVTDMEKPARSNKRLTRLTYNDDVEDSKKMEQV